MKVAIVGSGISGLGCAHALLAERHGVQVTLLEAAPRLGGHTNTVDVRLDGIEYPVDTGFLVFNERTYPNLIRLLAELDVPTAKSDMSFAVSVPAAGARRIEWAGTDLAGVFARHCAQGCDHTYSHSDRYSSNADTFQNSRPDYSNHSGIDLR